MACMDFILLVVWTSYLTRCWRNMMFIKLAKWNPYTPFVIRYYYIAPIGGNGTTFINCGAVADSGELIRFRGQRSRSHYISTLRMESSHLLSRSWLQCQGYNQPCPKMQFSGRSILIDGWKTIEFVWKWQTFIVVYSDTVLPRWVRPR